MNPPSATDPSAKADPESAVRFYGRRKGKPLKAGRQTLLEDLVPRLRITLEDGDQAIDISSFFDETPAAVRLEIGFGGGEHLAAQALANPEIGFVGSEVYVNGVASLARHVQSHGLTNIRVFDNDVRHLLPALRDNSLARVSLLFPDPWPKSRHAKRRFVGPAMLDEIARLLVDGGEFRVASDHPVYIAWTLMHAPRHPAFRWLVCGPEDWRRRPDDSVATRYEEKARVAGRAPVFLTFARRSRRA